MGFMTTFTILNDDWHDIQDNPHELISFIEQGMNYFSNKIVNRFKGNYIQIGRSHHADNPRLYLVHENMMTSLGFDNDTTNVELRKKMLKIAKTILKAEEEKIKELEVSIKP